MALFAKAAFKKFVATLSAATLSEQWEATVGKVGGKVFVLHADSSDALVFKVSELGFEGLTTIEGIGQAAYFAKGQWVNVAKGADISDADLKAYIRESHRIIAKKLTRKLQAELGLIGL